MSARSALTRDAVHVSDQENAEQHFGANRRPTRMTIARLQRLAHEGEVDVAINEPQQMIFGNVIFQ